MIKRLYDNIKHLIILVGLCVLLVGCDGGIFGTGDGSDPLISDSISASDSGVTDSNVVDEDGTDAAGDSPDDQETSTNAEPSQVGDSEAPVNVAPLPETPTDETTTELPPESPAIGLTPTENPSLNPTEVGSFTTDFVATRDAVSSINGQLSFTNSVVIDDSSTQIALVNDTDMTIGLFSSQDIDASSLVTIAPGAVGFGFVTPSTDVLYIDEVTENNERINRIVIDPLSLTNGSNTLAVLANTDAGLRLLAMPSYNDADTNGTIPLRFVFSFLAGDPAVPSILTLTPDPSAEGSTELSAITFDAISSELPITNYLNVPPGDYLLSDDAGRYSNVSIQVREDDSIRTNVFDSDGTSNSVGINF